MAFCAHCGKQIDDDAKVCPECGAEVEKDNTAKNDDLKNKASTLASKVNNGSDYSESMDAEDIQKNKVMAVLAYIGILFLVPLLAAKDSKYARFHTNQGIVLFIVNLILNIVGGIIGIFTFGIGSIITSLISLALMIIGIVNAATGKAKELPIIGKFTILK